MIMMRWIRILLLLVASSSVATTLVASTYVVISDVVFVREQPEKRLPAEDMTTKQLLGKSTEDLPKYLYYGANVDGSVDPAHPGVVAIRFHWYDKEDSGYA